MESWYDKEEDLLNLGLKKGKYWKSVELTEDIILDIDEKGAILSIEILRASKVLAKDAEKIIENLKEIA